MRGRRYKHWGCRSSRIEVGRESRYFQNHRPVEGWHGGGRVDHVEPHVDFVIRLLGAKQV